MSLRPSPSQSPTTGRSPAAPNVSVRAGAGSFPTETSQSVQVPARNVPGVQAPSPSQSPQTATAPGGVGTRTTTSKSLRLEVVFATRWSGAAYPGTDRSPETTGPAGSSAGRGGSAPAGAASGTSVTRPVATAPAAPIRAGATSRAGRGDAGTT